MENKTQQPQTATESVGVTETQREKINVFADICDDKPFATATWDSHMGIEVRTADYPPEHIGYAESIEKAKEILRDWLEEEYDDWSHMEFGK